MAKSDEFAPMVLDGIDEHFHIRRLDNRYRVNIHQPGWNVGGQWYGYVSIQRLEESQWIYVPGTVRTCSGRQLAIDTAKELWKTWIPK